MHLSVRDLPIDVVHAPRDGVLDGEEDVVHIPSFKGVESPGKGLESGAVRWTAHPGVQELLSGEGRVGAGSSPVPYADTRTRHPGPGAQVPLLIPSGMRQDLPEDPP